MNDKQELLQAANALLQFENAGGMFAALTKVMALPQNLPVDLSGNAAVLNPLLRLYRRDPLAYNGLMERIEARRAERGLPPLAEPGASGFDKNTYQAALMAEIRSRLFIAARVENLRRPPSSQLVGNARLEFMRGQRKKWMDRLKARLDLEPTPLPKSRRREISADFWENIDAELETAVADAHRWIQNGRKATA